MVNIQVIGIAKATAFLNAKNKEALARANDAIKKAGFWIQKELVASINGERVEPESVDTGFFKGSILSIFPTKLSANIGCNKYPVEYANNLEYSTKIKGGPRLHFAHTKTRNEKKVKDFVEAEIKTIG